MAQTCSICAHPERTAIEQAIAAGHSLRDIARQFSVSKDAIARHRDRCGALAVADARQEADVVRQRNVQAELDRALVRINKLFDACDTWLADPKEPDAYYLGPRADEVEVVYLDGDQVRKARLSSLLRMIGEHSTLKLGGGEWKVADPRKLILATAAQLTRQLELLAKLTGELDERPEINILVQPHWIEVRTALLAALAPHPAALDAVQRALAAAHG